MKKYEPDVFDDFLGMNNPLFGHHEKNLMKSDVRDKGNHYELLIDLPGFKKDDLKISLDDGYLTVSAEKSLDKEEMKEDGSLIRQERYAGNVSRSYYVGENVTESDVQAKYENGVLTVCVPKKEEEKVEKYISIM